ncbi:hypothetical protein SNE40_009212 [Patella caerulea]|uniref:BZIP domain-containing protein n=1 Tax=Patella caerulea TaxID=87958 RepID=A0AAN8JUN1_PATCE
MIKQYFTDGLIQIAIILSLLRTDLNSILNGNLIQYPEVQEILLGQTAAYIPSNIHNQFYSSNSLSNFVHPKNFDNDFNSVLFRDLQSLSRFAPFENTDISAFLVDAVSTLPSSFAASTPQDNTTPNINSSASVENNGSVELANGVTEQFNVTDDDTVGATALSIPNEVASDPSEEDLDLIDVLWRQDIDLGVGKDVFDVKLRRELERDREIELQKKREKQKELEILRQKLQDEKKNQEQLWRTNHFTQDGETGEWVPLTQDNNLLQAPEDIALTDVLNDAQLSHLDENFSLQEALDFLNQEVGNYSLFETNNNSILPPQEPVAPVIPVPQAPPIDTSYLNISTQPEPYYNQNQVVQPQNVERHESFEDRWQDLVTLLELTHESQPVDDATSMNISSMNISSPDSNDSVLLQNATLPVPPSDINLTSIIQTATNESGLMPPSQDYNASIPNTGSLTNLDWNTESMFLSNLSTNINSTEVGDLFMADEDLDIAFTEGLETIRMLDDGGSDSAISMGSASPIQEPNDSCGMSPYDGVEGATGGSDYDSPTFSKSSKYDGDEYHFNFNSYGYSRSESSPSNFSTSSNDTEFSRPSGDSQHIHHNHTYPAPPGMQPKEVKKYMKSEKPKHKGPAPKDAKRAAELKVPFTVEEITESPVEEFNEMLTKYKLEDAQLQLIRDIRRRGKNKVAAQNCRKRKMDLVMTVEEELTQLKHTRDKLINERQMIDKQAREMKAKFSQMYQEIFDSLRDEHGHPYDPNEYSLQQSSDGDVFLVPRNVSCASGNSEDQAKINKKRKNHKK